jgi:hypothetical protein
VGLVGTDEPTVHNGLAAAMPASTTSEIAAPAEIVVSPMAPPWGVGVCLDRRRVLTSLGTSHSADWFANWSTRLGDSLP